MNNMRNLRNGNGGGGGGAVAGAGTGAGGATNAAAAGAVGGGAAMGMAMGNMNMGVAGGMDGGVAYKTSAINNNYRYNGRNASAGTGIARSTCRRVSLLEFSKLAPLHLPISLPLKNIYLCICICICILCIYVSLFVTMESIKGVAQELLNCLKKLPKSVLELRINLFAYFWVDFLSDLKANLS